MNYVGVCLAGLDKTIKKKCDQVKNAEQSLRKIISQVMVETKSLEEHKALMHALEQSRKDMAEKAAQDFKHIQRLIERGFYEKVDVTSLHIKAYTGTVVINHEDKNYRIGKFCVDINLNDSWIRVANTQKSMHRGYCHHPHIDDDDEPCWGNIGAQISKLIGKSQFHLALELIHKYLCSYNRPDSYMRVESWPLSRRKKKKEVVNV